MRLAGFAAGRVLLALTFAGAAWGGGAAILRRLPFRSRIERAALSTVFGLGVLSTVLLCLACLRLLTAPAVALVLATGCLLGAARRGELSGAISEAGKRSLAAAALLLPLGYASLFPPTDPDSTMYHLPAAKAFAVSGALPALPDLRYPVFPQLSELLDAAALLVGGDVLVALLSLLWCVLVAALLVAWGMRFGDLRAGVWSAALWLGSPLVLLLARSGMAEPATAGFATASLLAVSAAMESGSVLEFGAAGALAGWAAGSKYTGLYFVAALLVAAPALARSGARARAAAIFAFGALAAAGPWYARNFVLSGNPVWPFLCEVFGYRFWSPTDVASAVWTLRREGGPRTFAALLALPWSLAAARAPGVRLLAPGLFALFPIGAAWGLCSRSRRWLVLVSLGALVFWFATTQQVRFLIPAVPAVCLLTAGGVSWIAECLPVRRPVATAALTAAALVLGVALIPGDSVRRVVRRGLPPVGDTERAAYFVSRLPSYPIYARLNAERGSRYTIYAFHDETTKYFCAGRQLGDWFGPASYSHVSLASGAALFESLRRFRADYLLVNDAFVPTRLPRDRDFDMRFEEIYRSGSVRAYRLH